jgi:eukaryotic-like serine/threonine-protein kinase
MATWNPRANEIFASALEMPPSHRQDYLTQACGADDELRRQVETLLAAHAEAGPFLERPAPAAALHASTTLPDSGPPLPAGASVVRALGAGLPRVQLRDLDDDDTAAPPTEPTELPERYRLEGEIARGGMGAVLKGRDTELGRQIAVKVLLETHGGRTELVQRFVEEAQIAGQLQHPGIVPIYEMGATPGKRPYFTMKLVKGQTLAKLLEQRQDPGDELTRFVAIFEQVCQTLAYAHARGVIHRDLKPANVMVGAFGEVQVMDWGLAKVLANTEREAVPAPEATSVIQTGPPSAGEVEARGPTQAGSVLGTPSYMAPEQARGEVELVNERADVFGLGAILCEILTGKPPFLGNNVEAMRRAKLGDLATAFARLDGCGADADLIELAKRCLAPEPEHRPGHAGEVAEAVTGYQRSVSQRLRQAEMERAQAQVKAAEERKRRKLAVGLAVAVLALVVGGTGGGLWLQRQQAERQAEQVRQQAERRHAVETALEKAAALQTEARWAEARAVLEQAEQRLGEGDETELSQRVRRALADLELVGELDDIRLEANIIVQGKFDFAGAARKYAAAFQKAGLGEPGDAADEVAARIRASSIREVLVAALDDWVVRSSGRLRFKWALAVARLADPEVGHERFRAAVVRADRAELEQLAGEAQEERLSPQLLNLLATALAVNGGDPVPLLQRAQERYPADFWLNYELGTFLLKANKEEGVGYLRAALALRPGNGAVYNNLADCMAYKGQVDEAIAYYQKAIDSDPRHAGAHNNLGRALAGKGQVDAAIACFQKAIDNDPKYVYAHYNLGLALFGKGQVDAAIACYQKAIDIDPKLAQAHNNLGNALAGKGQVDKAIACFQKAIDIDSKLARAHIGLGLALLQQGRFTQAEVSTRRALDLLPPGDPLRPFVAQQLEQCQRGLEREQKLPDVLSGKLPTTPAERSDYAYLCALTRRYPASARLYAEAFQADATLADNLPAGHRYNAAYAAAQAGCGQGNDADKLDDKERARLRQQAREWLRADLTSWSKQAASDKEADRALVHKTLTHWQGDPDLAGVRDPEALAKLPETERAEWQKLWAEVKGLLEKAVEKPQ